MAPPKGLDFFDVEVAAESGVDAAVTDEGVVEDWAVFGDEAAAARGRRLSFGRSLGVSDMAVLRVWVV